MYRTRLGVCLALMLAGCVEVPDVVVEAQPPDVVITQTCSCDWSSVTHDVYITEEFHETVYVTEEDTTPDVVREFYGDAASLPVLLLEGTGDTMPEKLSDLTAATALAEADQFVIEQSGTSKRIAASAFSAPFNYIAGLITSNDVSDIDHDVAIAPGIARSGDDSINMKLAAILTKQIDLVWAEGDDDGGLDTGSVAADTLYALWLIKNPTSGVVDALFSLSFTSPTLPASYTNLRLIGAVATDGSSNIVPYIQSGDYFRYLEVIQDIQDTTITTTSYETGTLSVPPKCMAHIYGDLENSGETSTSQALHIRYPGSDESGSAFADSWAAAGNDTDAQQVISAQGLTLVDASSQIEYAATEGAGSSIVTITTFGFDMLTRTNPQ